VTSNLLENKLHFISKALIAHFAVHHLIYGIIFLLHRQPCISLCSDDVTLCSPYSTFSPLSLSIVHSLFHSRLKIHLFQESFAPLSASAHRTASSDVGLCILYGTIFNVLVFNSSLNSP